MGKVSSLVYTVVGALVVSIIVAAFGMDSRVSVLEAKVIGLREEHKNEQVIIYGELKYIRSRVDEILNNIK